MKGKKAIYVIFILIQSIVYGIGNPITKIAYQSITPLWLLAIRFTMAVSVIGAGIIVLCLVGDSLLSSRESARNS